ncbi:MAG: L,D-transpeptidase [Thermodesulfobacteria bacterium]|nr:L,D-transpeptidase [Thermodesulfobacteriota bacterium]
MQDLAKPPPEKTGANATDSNASDKVIKILPDTSFKWPEHRDILPYNYAQVTEQPAPVYKGAWNNLEGKKPVKILDGGFIWVSLESPLAIKSGKYTWYYINPNEFLQGKYLSFFKVSTFKGVDLAQQPLDGIYGWLVLDTYTSAVPGKQEYLDGELLDKHTLVKILEIKFVKGQKWLKLAKGKWVDGRRVALITHPERPAKIPEDAKWVDINLYEQVLEAFEGDRMVYATLISSGLPEFETPTGLFRIWGKRAMAKMSGGTKGIDYYFLEDVPYHMYFFNGIALHGAYWHNNFGMKQSHGCVNLAPRDAFWLFNWTTPRAPRDKFVKSTPANPGTYVYVHH